MGIKNQKASLENLQVPKVINANGNVITDLVMKKLPNANKVVMS